MKTRHKIDDQLYNYVSSLFADFIQPTCKVFATRLCVWKMMNFRNWLRYDDITCVQVNRHIASIRREAKENDLWIFHTHNRRSHQSRCMRRTPSIVSLNRRGKNMCMQSQFDRYRLAESWCTCARLGYAVERTCSTSCYQFEFEFNARQWFGVCEVSWTGFQSLLVYWKLNTLCLELFVSKTPEVMLFEMMEYSE